MPLQPWMKLLSVDDHLIEHPRVWTDRLPKTYQARAPQIKEFPIDGKPPMQMWVYEGRTYPNIGLNAVAGKKPQEYGIEPVRYDDMIPGCYDPKARVADMDLDGVHAMLCFPSFPRFCGTVFMEAEDKELGLLCVQAWNDFNLDEWCATDPARFIPMSFTPMWDPALMVAEIERVAAKGSRAIGLPDNPTALALPSYHSTYWDPVFSAMEETNLTAVMHFGSGGFPPQIAPEAPFAVMITLMGTTSMQACTELIFSPVFHKHPNLKVAFSEGGVGWMPYLMERADYVWRKHKYYQNIHPTVKPSELFQRNIAGCFIEDEVGIADRHRIGVHHITWECDYPHSDSFWPKSRARAEEMFADVPDDEVHQMVELNTRRWYSFPEEGYKSCNADTGWRPNAGRGPGYDYDDVMAGRKSTGFEDFMQHIEAAQAEAQSKL
jgi:predicted TIM-barrel fold metal-dependent hydrolase